MGMWITDRIKKMMLLWMLGAFFFTGCGKVSEAYKTAMDLSEEGKYAEAKTYFEDAIKEDGSEPGYYIGYGMALNHLLKYEEAKKAFDQILKEKKKLSEEQKKQIYYGRCIALYGQGNYEEAFLEAKRALKIKEASELDRNLRYMGAVSGFMAGEREQAEKMCEKLLKNDDSDMEVYMLYGEMKKASGDTDGAIKIFEKAIGKEESYFDAYFGLYECYLDAGQSSAAAELLDQLTSKEAKETSELLAVGKAWYYKGDYERAQSFFEMVYEKGEPDGMFYLALTKKSLGKIEASEEKFLSYISEKKDGLDPEVYDQLAGIYMGRMQYDKAQGMISTGLSLGDTKAAQNLLRNQVILLELQGEYDKALKAAKEYEKVYSFDAAMKKEITFIKTRRK